MTTVNFTLLNNGSGNAGRTSKTILKSGLFGGVAGDSVRVTLQAAAASGFVCDAIYIGEVSTAPNAVSLTQLLFSGSGSSGSVPAGTTITTDWLSFSLDPTKDYVVSYHLSSGEIKYDSGATNTDAWFKNSANEAATASGLTGYTQDTAEAPFAVSSFEWAITTTLVFKRLLRLLGWKPRKRFVIQGRWPHHPRLQYVTPPLPSNLTWKQAAHVLRKPTRPRKRFVIRGAWKGLPKHILSINTPQALMWKPRPTNLRLRARQQRRRFRIRGWWPRLPKPTIHPFPPQPSDLTWRRAPHVLRKPMRPRKRFRIKGAYKGLPKHIAAYRVLEFVPWSPADGGGKTKKRSVQPALDAERGASPKLQK